MIQSQNRLTVDISEATKQGKIPFIGFLRHRLVFANSELLDSGIEHHYAHLAGSSSSTPESKQNLERAGLGIYLFCHHAERFGATRDDNNRQQANTFLSDPDVQTLLYDLYDVDEKFRHNQITLHEAGTTSFILKISSDTTTYALKIIKPWYFDDEVIAQQTSEYKTTYGYLATVIPDHFAKLYAANRSSIVMDFIEGITLRELFQTETFEPIGKPDGSVSEHSLVAVMVNLCALLGLCASHQQPTVHGDLSIANILVQPPSMKMYLIDFGTNYLLTRPVGTAEERSNTAFLASSRHEEQIVNGDLFRIGIILAQGLLGSAFSNDRVPAIVDRIYERYPSIGPFIDTVFFHAAQTPSMSGNTTPLTYQNLANDLEAEFTTLAEIEAKHSRRKLGVIDDLSLIVSPINLTQTFQFIWETFNNIGQRSTHKRTTSIELKNLTWVPLLMNYFVICMFFVTLFRHLNGSVWPDIIAWIGSLTYSIIAARYCVFVFRDLNLDEWPGWPKRSVPVMCVIIWPAILTPLLVEWSWWTFCVATGTAIIAINNQICISSYKTMLRAIDHHYRDLPSRLMIRTLDHLTNWRQLMSIFSVGVFILAILIWKNIVHDALFYGVIVATAPAFKMYLQQTGTEAPVVYAGFHRTINAYRQLVADRAIGTTKIHATRATKPFEHAWEQPDQTPGQS